MLFYLVYVIGYAGCWVLPRRLCYWVARRGADFYAWRAPKERQAVRRNLEVILGTATVSKQQVLDVFRNFAMYLVDFCRFGLLTPQKAGKLVVIEGLEYMREALAHGRGAIGLTAHIGNYELAGAVLALSGFQVHAAVLKHRNPYVNSFFINQRKKVGVIGLPLGNGGLRGFFEKGLNVLQQNKVLALVGDRDFTDHGINLPLFGKTLSVPTGPATFSVKSGARIVPGFLIREKGGTYRLKLERPIAVPEGLSRQEAVRHIAQECLQVMIPYIQRYPTQWYMFQEFWRPAPTFVH